MTETASNEEMGRAQLVVFDLGGTLVEETGLVPRCFARVLAGSGLELDEAAVQTVRGQSKKEAIRHLLIESKKPALSKSAAVGIETSVDGLYRQFTSALSEALAADPPIARFDARRTLEQLRGLGIAIAITTGFDRSIAEQILAQIGWGVSQVDALVSSDEVSQSRPAPDMIQEAMSRLDVSDPSHVAKVGDTVADMLAGAAANVGWNIAVCGGAHPRAHLEGSPATHVVKHLGEVPGILHASAQVKHRIRQVFEDDLPRCLEIEGACFPPDEAASEQSIRTRIRDYPEAFLVLEFGGRMVGIINSGAIHDEDLSKEELKVLEGHDPAGANLVVFSVAIHPEYQGLGLSKRLLHAYFDRARDLNKSSILLICKQALVPFYERFGFENLGRSPSTHGGAIWFQMKKRLREAELG